uniref:Uncharacterized protein LOC111117543 isoform X2 n=1 Tax=Crassostrea virginica TaxID=6565 RepID=A0A8B8C9H5_CRAVI|nr:uncharacterized protein LOC111117543 isoform X2 [Crassostrea virginica]
MNEYRIFLTGEVAGAWKRLVGRFYWLHDNQIIEHLLEIHNVYCKHVCLLDLSNETQTSRLTGNKEKPDLIPSATISTEIGLASRLHGIGSTESVTRSTEPNKTQPAEQSMDIKEEPESMEFTESENLRNESLLPLNPSTRDPGGGGISSAGELDPSSKSSLPVIVNVASLANIRGQEVTPLVQSLGLEVTPRIQQPVMQDLGVNLYSQGQKVLWIVKNAQSSVQPLNPHCIQSVNQNDAQILNQRTAHLVSQNSVQIGNPNSIQSVTQQNTAKVVNPNITQLLNQSSAHLVNQNTANSVQSVNPSSIQLMNQNSTQSVKQYSAQAVNLNNAQLLNQRSAHLGNPNSSHEAENLSEKVDQEHGRNQERKESVSRNSAEEDEGPSTSVVDDSETDDEFSEDKESSTTVGIETMDSSVACSVTTPYYRCCVPMCNNDSRLNTSGQVTFHDFPTDKTKRKEWIQKIQRDKEADFHISSSTVVCSAHFLPAEIGTSSTGLKQLKPGSVPSLFPWNPVVKLVRPSMEMSPANTGRRNEELTTDTGTQQGSSSSIPSPSHKRMENRMYQYLACNNEEYSHHCSPAMQQNSTYHETQGVSKSCDYKCICCARLHVGNPCSCNVSTTTISTQTEQDVPRGLNADWFWKRGTYEHSVLQKRIREVFHKYQVSGPRDLAWETATSEVMTFFSQSMPQTQEIRRKLQERMKKALDWIRYYGKKQVEAQNQQISVHSLMRGSKTPRAASPACLIYENESGASDCSTEKLDQPIPALPCSESDDGEVSFPSLVKRRKRKKKIR